MWIAKASRWQESNEWHFLSPGIPSGKNTRRTLALALSLWKVTHSRERSSVPRASSVGDEGNRKAGLLSGVLPSPHSPIPGAFSLENTFSVLTQQLAFLGLENKHTLNTLFPKDDSLTINIYQATNNWEHKGTSHEKFFIKNVIHPLGSGDDSVGKTHDLHTRGSVWSEEPTF